MSLILKRMLCAALLTPLGYLYSRSVPVQPPGILILTSKRMDAWMFGLTCSAADAHFLAWPELKADAVQGIWKASPIPQGHTTELQVPLVGPLLLA